MRDYYSFERVLAELHLDESELKRLVSEGEIRAYRDDDLMKFKVSDIQGLKRGRQTEPTIILPSVSASASSRATAGDEESEVILVGDDTEETILDVADLDSPVATETFDGVFDMDDSSGFSDSSGLSDSSGFSDSSSLAVDSTDAGEETFVDSSSMLATEPLDLLDEDSSDSSDAIVAIVAARAIGPAPAARPAPDTPTARRTRSRDARPGRPAPVSTATSPVFGAFLVLSFAILLYASMVVLGISAGSDAAPTRPATDLAARLAPAEFAGDPRINPGAVLDQVVSEEEVLWYVRWRDR